MLHSGVAYLSICLVLHSVLDVLFVLFCFHFSLTFGAKRWYTSCHSVVVAPRPPAWVELQFFHHPWQPCKQRPSLGETPPHPFETFGRHFCQWLRFVHHVQHPRTLDKQMLLVLRDHNGRQPRLQPQSYPCYRQWHIHTTTTTTRRSRRKLAASGVLLLQA